MGLAPLSSYAPIIQIINNYTNENNFGWTTIKLLNLEL